MSKLCFAMRSLFVAVLVGGLVGCASAPSRMSDIVTGVAPGSPTDNKIYDTQQAQVTFQVVNGQLVTERAQVTTLSKAQVNNQTLQAVTGGFRDVGFGVMGFGTGYRQFDGEWDNNVHYSGGYTRRNTGTMGVHNSGTVNHAVNGAVDTSGTHTVDGRVDTSGTQCVEGHVTHNGAINLLEQPAPQP